MPGLAMLGSLVHPLFAQGDPLFDNGVGWFVWVVVVIRCWWPSQCCWFRCSS